MEKLKNNKEIESTLAAIAAMVFTDEHYGRAISEEEFEYKKKIEENYKQEIEYAKTIVLTYHGFSNLTNEEKVSLCVELIRNFMIRNNKIELERDYSNQINIAPKSEEKYADENDLLDKIPQEPYEPIEHSSIGHK